MAFTPYANELAQNFMLTTASVTRLTAWYLAWHIGPPGDDGSANEQTVGGDADYARQVITFDAASWSSILKKAYCLNNNTIDITPATSTSYTIYGFSIWDSLTAGNCLLSVDSPSAISVSDVSPVSIIAGKIPVSITREFPTVGWTSVGARMILDWLLTTATVTRPTAWYFAPHTADPGDDGSANEVTTGDDPDYVRKVNWFSAASTSGGTSSINDTDSIWTPGSGANFTAPYVGVWDALTVGNSLFVAAAVPELIGVAAQTMSISTNELKIIGRI